MQNSKIALPSFQNSLTNLPFIFPIISSLSNTLSFQRALNFLPALHPKQLEIYQVLIKTEKIKNKIKLTTFTKRSIFYINANSLVKTKNNNKDVC